MYLETAIKNRYKEGYIYIQNIDCNRRQNYTNHTISIHFFLNLFLSLSLKPVLQDMQQITVLKKSL